MSKETFYFTHDFHARKDPKCMALIKEFGATGYGIYWCLIEIMYEQGGRIKKFPALYSGLAYEFQVEEKDLLKQIEAMLHRFELLVEDDKYLWSASILNRLNIREAKRSTKSESGKLGGIKSGESRRNRSKRSTASEANEEIEANEAKERKGKESKVIIKKGFNSNPLVSDFNGIPEIYSQKSIEAVMFSSHVKIDKKTVTGMWDIFKVQNLTGENYYQNEGKVYSHFLNWIKNQKIQSGGFQGTKMVM